MEVETTSNAPAFLVTSDVYYPGWQATIDDAHTEIFQTNYALRGVQVPPDAHNRFLQSDVFTSGSLAQRRSLIVLCSALFPVEATDTPEMIVVNCVTCN